jgi:ADP-heptose:LPS heptosyltransferase
VIDVQWAGARRILAVRLDNLGDVLVTTPAIHALKTGLPTAEITLLASPVGAQVGRLNPDLTGVIVHEAPWVDPWQRLPHDSGRERRTMEAIRSQAFDAAVIFTSFRQSSLPAAYLCYLADIPLRLASSIDGPGSLLTTRHHHAGRLMHEVERGLDLVGAVGFEPAELDLVLQVPDAAAQCVDRWISTTVNRRPLGPIGPLVVVHPGCSMPARTSPPEQFAEIVTHLIDEMNATVVLTGSAEERALVEMVMSMVPAELHQAVLPTAGVWSFDQLCALIQSADLAVTNNTGPMHIAAAVKTPVIVLFALTNPPEQWGPWRVPHRLLYREVPCRLCYSRTCPHNQECVRLVSVEEVLDAASPLLAEPGTSYTTSRSGAFASVALR